MQGDFAPDWMKQWKKISKESILIGWDAADWKIISPLMDAGHMPTLEN